MNPAFFDPAFVGSSPDDTYEFILDLLRFPMDMALLGFGHDARLRLWSKGARRLYGYQPEEVVGRKSVNILYPPEGLADDRPRAIMQAAQRDGRWEGVVTQLRKGGQSLVVRAVLTARHDSSGRDAGFLLWTREVANENGSATPAAAD